MQHVRNSRLLVRTVAAIAALIGWGAIAAHADNPAFAPGEVVVYMQPGTPQATVQALAANVGATTVNATLLADCYQFVLPAGQRTIVGTTDAVATLKTDANVKWAGPNRYYYTNQAAGSIPTKEPNDARYLTGEMWGLKMINMPNAWAIQIGQPGTNVAVVDSGMDNAHPDLKGQFLPQSFDFADNTNVIAPDDLTGGQHGTHVSGTIGALTNNSIGIAGVCWGSGATGVQILGCKVHPKGAKDEGFPGLALVNALAFILQQKDALHIVAVNASYGLAGDNPNDATSPLYVATKALCDAGVIFCAAAGNDAKDNTISTPAGYTFPNLVTVSALGPTGKLASFSSFGKVDIAAPGGDINATGKLTDGILSCYAGDYAFLQGTSMATPHVTGVMALLMSTQGLSPVDAVKALKDGANKTGLTTFPDPKYGYGVMDAYQSLLRVSVLANVTDPAGTTPRGIGTDSNGLTQPTETLKPTLRFSLTNVDPTTVKITVDGGTALTGAAVTSDIESGVAPSRYVVSFRQHLSPGTHTLAIIGTNTATGRTATDTRTITIIPHTVQAGRSFISVPYYEGPLDGGPRNQDQLLGSNFVLHRWVPSDGKYAVYSPGVVAQQGATFTPADSAPAPDNMSTATQPVGLAYWIDTPASIAILTNGQSFTKLSYRIPLHGGWNMIGDPYPFSLAFNSCLIEIPGGNRTPVQTAADQGLILPHIYRYNGTGYDLATLPDGAINPWEGQWIFVNPGIYGTLNLITVPLPNTQNTVGRAGTKATVSSSVGWKLQIQARTKNLADTGNYIGVTTRSAVGAAQAPKPPYPGNYVSAGILRPDLPAGLYAQDLRPTGPQTWNLAVTTDQTDAPVQVTWPNVAGVPRNVRLVLTDKSTGATVDMRSASSYQFVSAHIGGTREFTITAVPNSAGGRALVSAMYVNHAATGRAAGAFEIGYNVSRDAQVEVSVLGPNGRPVATIPSRAVSAGNNHVVWNGADSVGRQLPMGTYVVQIRVVTAEGAISRSVLAFQNSGR